MQRVVPIMGKRSLACQDRVNIGHAISIGHGGHMKWMAIACATIALNACNSIEYSDTTARVRQDPACLDADPGVRDELVAPWCKSVVMIEAKKPEGFELESDPQARKILGRGKTSSGSADSERPNQE